MARVGQVLDDRFVLVDEIGRGSFGVVFACDDPVSGRRFAVKTEPRNCEVDQLMYERDVYDEMKRVSCVPRVHGCGISGDCKYLVMDLFQTDLMNLVRRRDGKLPLRRTDELAVLILSALREVHEAGFVHRDVKPHNFMLDSSGNVRLVDFGLCKKYIYRDRRGVMRHIPWRSNKGFTGNAQYASTNALSGVEQARRDDIVSAIYTLVRLCKGRLPWSSVSGKKNRTKRILRMKRGASSGEICDGLPRRYRRALRYARGLSFKQTPNYKKLARLFAV